MVLFVFELELELMQLQMAQKPMLRVKKSSLLLRSRKP
jgi:hypothetical protein